MRKAGIILCAAVLALCCTGCGGNSEGSGAEQSQSSSEAEQQTGLHVEAPEDFDEAYKDCITKYFQAINDKDFAAYEETVYPPYQEVYGTYLKNDGSSLEQAFADMCKMFDEDGYESWQLTDLVLSYYGTEPEDMTSFFSTYEKAGVFDSAFTEQTQKDAKEMRDVKFTLYALYAGDDEPVAVAQNRELIVIKNGDGAYLFG